MPLNRRRFLATAGLTTAAAIGLSPVAKAQRTVVGTALDYSAGVPSGRSVKAAGHLGAVRYVSERRPGADIALLAGLAVTVHGLAGRRSTHAGGLPSAVEDIVLGLPQRSAGSPLTAVDPAPGGRR